MIDHQASLACEAACSRLIADFAFHVDARQYEQLVALFTEDGTFERRGEVLKGRQAILLAMQARPADVRTRHVCTNVRIDPLDDGSATGNCTLLMFHGATANQAAPAAAPYAIVVAEYQDRYVATPQGWRIASRVAQAIF